MLGPIQALFIITLMVFYEFALIGMYMFGGVIQNNSEVFNVDQELGQAY